MIIMCINTENFKIEIISGIESFLAKKERLPNSFTSLEYINSSEECIQLEYITC